MKPAHNDANLEQPNQQLGAATEHNQGPAEEDISTPPKGTPKRRGEVLGTSARVHIGTSKKRLLRF